MAKLTIDDLARIRERGRHATMVRQGAGRVRVTVHMGECGIAAGARGIMTAVLAELESRGLYDVLVMNSGCAGVCNQEPMMTVDVTDGPPPVEYVSLTPEKARAIIDSHVVKGKAVADYALKATAR